MLSTFVEDLIGGRPLRVGPPAAPNDADLQQALATVVEFERQTRFDLPGEAPAIDPHAARWSLVSLYLAASLVIHRDVNATEIDQLLRKPQLDHTKPEVHYSVDLTMRFLPSLMQFAKSASSDDPLVKRLQQWARDWPLSSVGMKDVGAVDIAHLRTSKTLMRLYVDRIFHTEDTSRLADPHVQAAAAAVLGNYQNLNPKIASALAELQPTA